MRLACLMRSISSLLVLRDRCLLSFIIPKPLPPSVLVLETYWFTSVLSLSTTVVPSLSISLWFLTYPSPGSFSKSGYETGTVFSRLTRLVITPLPWILYVFLEIDARRVPFETPPGVISLGGTTGVSNFWLSITSNSWLLLAYCWPPNTSNCWFFMACSLFCILFLIISGFQVTSLIPRNVFSSFSSFFHISSSTIV